MGMKIKVRSRPMLRGLQSLRSEVVLNVVRRSSSGILSPPAAAYASLGCVQRKSGTVIPEHMDFVAKLAST